MDLNKDECKIVLACLGDARLGRIKGCQISPDKAADLYSKVYDNLYVKTIPANKRGRTSR